MIAATLKGTGNGSRLEHGPGIKETVPWGACVCVHKPEGVCSWGLHAHVGCVCVDNMHSPRGAPGWPRLPPQGEAAALDHLGDLS